VGQRIVSTMTMAGKTSRDDDDDDDVGCCPGRDASKALIPIG